MINLLDDTTNQPFKFRTRNGVEINDESRGTYNHDDNIKFKISMIRSRSIYVIIVIHTFYSSSKHSSSGCSCEPGLDNNGNITDFPASGNKIISFSLIPLKYLSNFWRTLEINLQLTCSKKSILAAGTAVNQVLKFRITDTKIYVPVVTL